VAYVKAPGRRLTDGVVTLRLPSAEVGDVDAIVGYVEREQLDGHWLPGIPLVSAEHAIADWLAGWAGYPRSAGAVFVVTVPGAPHFVGIVGFIDRSEGCIEMTYGIAPSWRGRGLASRAARLAAHWALTLPGVTTVELRIAQRHAVSQHVATNAGFVAAGTITQYVPGTGETFEDLRYILGSQTPMTADSPLGVRTQ